MNKKQQYNSDIEALEAFNAGEESAFNYLYHTHYSYVFDFVSKRLNFNKPMAREITSHAFTNFYRSAGKFDMRYKIKLDTFLCKIADNLIIDSHRKLERRIEGRSLPLSFYQKDSGELMIADNIYPSPESIVDRKIINKILHSKIASLDSVSNKILTYFYKDELSYQEICIRLDLPLHSVKARLFRARKKLSHSLINSGIW